MSAVETLEQRIRECAYYMWEASGRPSGRDEEFWRRACEMLSTDHDQPMSKPTPRQPKQTSSARKRGRRPERQRAAVPA